MKRTVVLCTTVLLLIGSAIYAFGDIARPKVTPTAKEGKTVLYTSMTVKPDPKAYEARLQISQSTLQSIAHEAATHRRVVTTAFIVIFLAEWGDLTQILTANLAVHYHSPLSVGLGALIALWAVAALAVASGQGLLRYLSIRAMRRVTGVVLLILAAVAGWSALA